MLRKSLTTRLLTMGLIGAALSFSASAVMQDDALSLQEKKASKLQKAETAFLNAQGSGTQRVIVKYRMQADHAGPSTETTTNAIDILSEKTRTQAILSAQSILNKKLNAHEARVIKHLSHLPFSALQVDQKALKTLQNDASIEAIYADVLRKPLLADSGPLVGATSAAAAGATGAGQVVAIIDTGVDKTHGFLSGKVVHEACFSTTNTNEGSTSLCPNGSSSQGGSGAGTACSSAIAGCGHGTHVAGIAAGKGSTFSGVARDANIMAIQVFSRFSSAAQCGSTGPCVMSYTSDQLSALNHVYSQRGNFNIAAVNMSLGGGQFSAVCDNDPLKSAIDLLRSAGIATVVAAGNEGYTQALAGPACISSAISVGATTKSDNVSSFSNSASFLDLLAPGSAINSSVPGGSYSSFSGTSMAAPHVAGAIAVLKGINTSASVDQIEVALKQTGQSITDSRNGLSLPRIDVNAARAVINPPATPTLFISPDNNLQIIGPVGGTFSPTSQRYTLRNFTSSGSGLNYTVSESANWLTVSPASGTLAANGSAQITLSLTTAANSLAVGDYNTTLRFRNTTNGNGNTDLSITLSVTDDNDFFVNAVQLGRTGDTNGTITISNNDATRETNEPRHAKVNGTHSLWWKWTAPANGSMNIDTCNSDFDTTLAVYTGTALNLLAETTSNDDACDLQSEVDWDARAGVTYYIAVDGYSSTDVGTISMAWDYTAETTASPNISVLPANAINFSGASSGPFSPSSSTFTVINVGTSAQSINVSVPVWLTSSQDSFSLEPGAQTSVTFSINQQANALPPGLYDGLIDFGHTARSVTLNITSGSLSNNHFGNARVINDTSPTLSWNNDLADKQTGEPNHAGNRGGKSVWWRWTPSFDGTVTLDTEGSTFDTLLAVYTGSQVSALTLVGENDDGGTGFLSKLTIDVTRGSSYYIAVDGYHYDSASEAESGQFKLTIQYDKKAIKHDFNSDGTSDILWRNANTGWNYLYTMSGFTPLANSPINRVQDRSWKIAVVDDFNGDKQTDILWRNSKTGDNWLYTMNGNTITASQAVNSVSHEWLLVGSGDFNGDLKADLLWRNLRDGNNWVYLMDGPRIVTNRKLNQVADQNWQVASIADLNGDNKDDLVWRHQVTGDNYVYQLDGTRITVNRRINAVTDLNWKIVGSGDFNGDNKDDILWRHQANGTNWLYLMNGSQITTSQAINRISDTNWKVEAVGDFNADQRTGDILWRHQRTGQVWLYLMNSNVIAGSDSIANVAPEWTIEPQ